MRYPSGRVTAAAPLIRALRARQPDSAVLLTTATPTGQGARQGVVRRCGRRAIPPLRYAGLDAALSQAGAAAAGHHHGNGAVAESFSISAGGAAFPSCSRTRGCRRNPWPGNRRLGTLFRDVFAGGTMVAAQSAEDARRFIAIGASPDRTRIVGNLKFDIEIDAAVVRRGLELRGTYGASRPVWIAGSTHAGEEEAALTAHARLRSVVPDMLLLLVPRHPERFQAVADLLTRRGFSIRAPQQQRRCGAARRRRSAGRFRGRTCDALCLGGRGLRRRQLGSRGRAQFAGTSRARDPGRDRPLTNRTRRRSPSCCCGRRRRCKSPMPRSYLSC